jgi:hypothetical protein
MLNQSTIPGAQFFGGSVVNTAIRSEGVVRGDRADSKQLGKRLHHRLRHPMARVTTECPPTVSAIALPGDPWHVPAGLYCSAVATAAMDMPARAWASLIVARAV